MVKVTSQKGVDLIKSFEGCALKAYLCPASVWTIGYGHTGNVKPGDTLTKAEAETLLKKDLKRYEDGVNTYVKVPINQYQFDSLVSFCYNLGVGSLQKSTLLELLNKGDFKGAANEFARWNKASNRILSGLSRRRAAEAELFNTLVPIPKAVPKKEAPKPVKKPIPKPQPKVITHKVQSGEFLGKIAVKYGVSEDSIAKLNGIKNKNLIKVGQILKIQK